MSTLKDNNPRMIKLLFVRHGEREDEVADVVASTKLGGTAALSSSSFRATVDRLDPLLTKEGHRQAVKSFKAIAATLPKNSRIAVFSSPLRRAIGTALMMGVVPFDESIRWTSPEDDGKGENEQCDDDDNDADGSRDVPSSSSSCGDQQRQRVIPITVLNGLGDFAARVHRLGGTSVLVPRGLVRCGTDPTTTNNNNDNDNNTTGRNISDEGDSCNSDSFMKSLSVMPASDGCLRSGSDVSVADPQQQNNRQEGNGNIDSVIVSQVQFWAPAGRSDDNPKRLTSPIDPRSMPHRPETNAEKRTEIEKQEACFKAMRAEEEQRVNGTSSSSSSSSWRRYKSKLPKLRTGASNNNASTPPAPPSAPPLPDPIGAVDEAIRIAAKRGCDICIVVAHREGIRDLKEICNHRDGMRLPYCCIGSFGATLEESSDSDGDSDKLPSTAATTTVSYNFWNVWTAETFGRYSLPRCPTPPPPFCGDHTELVRLMMVNQDEVLCFGCIRRDWTWKGWYIPTSEVWLKPRNREHFPRRRDDDRVFSINAEIVVGGSTVEERTHEGQQKAPPLTMIHQYLDQLTSKNCILCFDSVVHYQSGAASGVGGQKKIGKRTCRFRFSRRTLFETDKVLLKCVIV